MMISYLSTASVMDQFRDLTQPHCIFKPKVFKEGNKWCALYGDNIQEGVCGFGDTPIHACIDFNARWAKP